MTNRLKENENNFTSLRLLLALMVVFGHFKLLSGTKHPAFPFDLADAAVDAFFVVSGFLITLSYERSRGLWPFYVRRIFRLYPMYVCAVVIQTAIMLALLPNGPLSELRSTVQYLIANLLLANFLQYDIGGVLSGVQVPGINPSLWTLKIEIGFYLIVPLIYAAVRRWSWVALALIFAGSTLYSLAMLHLGDVRLARQLPGQLQFFVVGMALYLYGRPLRVPRLVSVAVVVGFFAVWSLIQPIPSGLRPIVVAVFVFDFALCLPAVPLRSDMSYSVYLLQGPLLQTAILIGVFRDTLWFLGGVLCVVLALAFVAERLVERPGNALGRALSVRLECRAPSLSGAV